MFTNAQVWNAIDALAERQNMTLARMARDAGLDPTIFNVSKRVSPRGKPRWPSLSSLARLLMSTGTPVEVFVSLMSRSAGYSTSGHAIPLIGMAQAGTGGFFDDAGFPVGGGWEEVNFPEVKDENAYALEVSGDSMEPICSKGDILIVSPNTDVRRGDRVVVKTLEGQVLFKTLKRQTARTVELSSVNPDHDDVIFDLDDIDWIARVLWISQ